MLGRLKEIDPDAEVIVFTGHGDMELAVRSLQNEASDFINKPVQRQALEVALKRAEEKISLKRQLRDYTRNLETGRRSDRGVTRTASNWNRSMK